MGLVLVFSFVILFGAPYLPTRRREAQDALDLLDLKKGQTLYELGCGDGRVLLQAARRGLSVTGYELNPILALVSWLVTWRYRQQVRVVCGNFWTADLSQADGIFVFLIDRYMKRLDSKLTEIKKPLRLVSYAFKIPNKKPTKIKNGLILYVY
jgi:16S rRNA A1518/A1519 N6-dimethyltransferase RsmA/KsgA/DIM1 with predicted DNA glycosylase/AP lyase activity